MTQSKKILCWVYFAIAFVALVSTWSQNLYYFTQDAPLPPTMFITDLFVNAASRSFTYDLLLLFLAAAIWMVQESKKLKIKNVWLYIVFGVLVAISVTFPLFLIAREKKLAASSAT